MRAVQDGKRKRPQGVSDLNVTAWIAACVSREDEECLRKAMDKPNYKVGFCNTHFPANSLRIPWWLRQTQCLCGFQTGFFFYGKKFPAKFPAQGICA